ncbi:hypothetical protein BDN71DRAFT_1172150 [Pleurotus eryngii]|uniref:Uncharacterized protein n=1 Tax=Pleurotus eryngii TaxID=5323 RepID=A0A9P5ZVX9_PLEER|nr:hypothetical protein BDN71DRAFT_1172150 [Pleurotus eryngii]
MSLVSVSPQPTDSSIASEPTVQQPTESQTTTVQVSTQDSTTASSAGPNEPTGAVESTTPPTSNTTRSRLPLHQARLQLPRYHPQILRLPNRLCRRRRPLLLNRPSLRPLPPSLQVLSPGRRPNLRQRQIPRRQHQATLLRPHNEMIRQLPSRLHRPPQATGLSRLLQRPHLSSQRKSLRR